MSKFNDVFRNIVEAVKSEGKQETKITNNYLSNYYQLNYKGVILSGETDYWTGLRFGESTINCGERSNPPIFYYIKYDGSVTRLTEEEQEKYVAILEIVYKILSDESSKELDDSFWLELFKAEYPENHINE